MENYYRVIADTPCCGEEFIGHCGLKAGDEDRLHEFADLLITENAEEHILDHIDDITDEEACDEFYEGCGAIFQEIDYSTYMEEAFEDYERKEDCV